MITANRPLNFKPWDDFPGLERVPSGTMVSKGKFLNRELVYFSNPELGIGFSVTADAAKDIDKLLLHWQTLVDM